MKYPAERGTCAPLQSDDEPGMVIVCAGPPMCELEDDEAVEAAKTGCTLCRRVTIRLGGSETETGPGHA